MDAKKPGDQVYVSGITRGELGGSEYWSHLGFTGNSIPKVRLSETLPRYRALERAIAEGLVASCHDCSDGGLGVSLAETAFSGGLGIVADLSQAPCENITRDDELLFSESAGRFVITVKQENAARFEELMAGTDTAWVGEVTAEPYLVLRGLSGTEVVRAEEAAMKAAWQKPLAKI
jgi:phosphoribosylformylglycinamidine synthase